MQAFIASCASQQQQQFFDFRRPKQGPLSTAAAVCLATVGSTATMARASEATKQLEKAILATAADHPEVGAKAVTGV